MYNWATESFTSLQMELIESCSCSLCARMLGLHFSFVIKIQIYGGTCGWLYWSKFKSACKFGRCNVFASCFWKFLSWSSSACLYITKIANFTSNVATRCGRYLIRQRTSINVSTVAPLFCSQVGLPCFPSLFRFSSVWIMTRSENLSDVLRKKEKRNEMYLPSKNPSVAIRTKSWIT